MTESGMFCTSILQIREVVNWCYMVLSKSFSRNLTHASLGRPVGLTLWFFIFYFAGWLTLWYLWLLTCILIYILHTSLCSIQNADGIYTDNLSIFHAIQISLLVCLDVILQPTYLHVIFMSGFVKLMFLGSFKSIIVHFRSCLRIFIYRKFTP